MRAYRMKLAALAFFSWFLFGASADEWRLTVNLTEATVSASRTPEIRAAWATRLAGVESACDASNLIAQLTDEAGTVFAQQDSWDTSGSDAVGLFDLNTTTLTNFFGEYAEDGIAYFTLTVWDTGLLRRIVRDRVALRNAPVPPSGPAPTDPPPLYLAPFVILPTNEFAAGMTIFSSDLGQTTYAATPAGGGTVDEIADLPTAELVASKVLKPDGAGGVTWGNDATGGPQLITAQVAGSSDTAKVLKPDGAGGVTWGTDADTIVTEIANLPAAENDTAKVLKPNGAGGVTWGTDASSSVTELADLPTAETDQGKTLRPDGAGGVEWVTGSGATLAGAMTGDIELNSYDLVFNSSYGVKLEEALVSGYPIHGFSGWSSTILMDLWNIAGTAGSATTPSEGSVLTYLTDYGRFAPRAPANFAWYDSMVAYKSNQLVHFEGHLYAMTNDSNGYIGGYSPTAWPQSWQQIDGGGASGGVSFENEYNGSTYYSAGQIAHHRGSLFLYTNSTSQMGQDPHSSPAYWQPLGMTWKSTYDAMASYVNGDMVQLEGGRTFIMTNAATAMSGYAPDVYPEYWLDIRGPASIAGSVYEVIGLPNPGDYENASNVTIRAGSYSSGIGYSFPGTVFIQGGTNAGMGIAQYRHGDIDIRTVGADHDGSGMGGNGGDITIATGKGGTMGGTNGALRCIAGYAAGLDAEERLGRFVFGSVDESVAHGGMASDGKTMRVGVGGAQISFGVGAGGSSNGWLKIERGASDTTITFTNSTILVDGFEVYSGPITATMTMQVHKGFCIGAGEP